MNKVSLPPRAEMVEAFIARDNTYDGVFYTGVTTTGIFCRPGCSAKKPKSENVEFFATPGDALYSGYRPCKRCRPLEPLGQTPDWLAPLLERIEAQPTRRWTDRDLRDAGLHPDRVRRWFQTNHGITFHAYARARRLGLAMEEIRHGSAVTPVAFDHGYESLSGFNSSFLQLFGQSPTRSRDAVAVGLQLLTTPLGPMVAGATDAAVCLLEFADRRMLEKQLQRLQRRLDCSLAPGRNRILDQLGRELEAYFRGTLQQFSVPVLPAGTKFQETVWKSLRRIPYGRTVSYADVARDISHPTAMRAVARANGDNRIAILIPCHRVIGKNGKLTGYGGGLWRKQRLLDLERLAADDIRVDA